MRISNEYSAIYLQLVKRARNRSHTVSKNILEKKAEGLNIIVEKTLKTVKRLNIF
jgi:plasmid rolling circle replication initiator protein Rep